MSNSHSSSCPSQSSRSINVCFVSLVSSNKVVKVSSSPDSLEVFIIDDVLIKCNNVFSCGLENLFVGPCWVGSFDFGGYTIVFSGEDNVESSGNNVLWDSWVSSAENLGEILSNVCNIDFKSSLWEGWKKVWFSKNFGSFWLSWELGDINSPVRKPEFSINFSSSNDVILVSAWSIDGREV